MEKMSETLFSLKPVSFRYKKEADLEGRSPVQFELVAENVEKPGPGDFKLNDKKCWRRATNQQHTNCRNAVIMLGNVTIC